MNLKAIRKSNGLTQEEVAILLNIKQSTYSGYETNKSEPDINILKKMSQIFRVSIDELVGNEANNIINKWQLSEVQKANLYLIQNLSEKFNLIANGYLLRLADEQQKENL